MAGARRYRLIAAWALVQVAAGLVIMLGAGLAAFAVLSPWPAELVARVPDEWRARLAPVAVPGLLVALAVGGSLVVSGQMLRLLRDVHRHVARLDRRARRRPPEPVRPADRSVTSRLLPRR